MRRPSAVLSHNHQGVIAAEPFARRWMGEIVVTVFRRGSHADVPNRRVADDGIFNRRVERRTGMSINRVDAPVRNDRIRKTKVEAPLAQRGKPPRSLILERTKRSP